MGLFGSSLYPRASYDTPMPTDKEQAYRAWLESLPPQMRSTADYDLQGAFLAGEGQGGNAHMTDRFKKPNHPTFSDESQYSTPQQPGGHWAGDNNGSWGFWASPANFQHQSLADLLQYFAQAEPGNRVFVQSNWRMPGR